MVYHSATNTNRGRFVTKQRPKHTRSEGFGAMITQLPWVETAQKKFKKQFAIIAPAYKSVGQGFRMEKMNCDTPYPVHVPTALYKLQTKTQNKYASQGCHRYRDQLTQSGLLRRDIFHPLAKVGSNARSTLERPCQVMLSPHPEPLSCRALPRTRPPSLSRASPRSACLP